MSIDNSTTASSEFPWRAPRDTQAPLALAGLRVLDFTHFLAGPFATMIMGDMGADVIKIENPGKGEDFRHFPPVRTDLPAQGGPFLWGNRNKRSLAVDLKSPQGLQAIRDLIAVSDVLVENFSTGVMDKFGLSYEACRAINPRLVYCSVSAYGRTGEFADRSGFDPIAQAESGFMDMNGHRDSDGVRTQSPVVDIQTATMACTAILGALLARHQTGEGQYIDVPLFDNALIMTGYAAMQHLMTGQEVQRQGNISADSCPTGKFMSKDKPFYLICGNDKIFQRLALEVLDRPDLVQDPELATRAGRAKRRAELIALLGHLFSQHPWSYWQPRMRSASVPCGEIRTVAQALRSPEAASRQLVTRIPHPEVGWIYNVELPIRFGGTPAADPRPAPAVGANTQDILRDVLGYDEGRIEALCQPLHNIQQH